MRCYGGSYLIKTLYGFAKNALFLSSLENFLHQIYCTTFIILHSSWLHNIGIIAGLGLFVAVGIFSPT